MIACQRDFTITVQPSVPSVPTVDGYWNLNEAAANADRVAQTGGHNLLATGVTEAGTPALIGNGVIFDATFGGAGYNTGAFATFKHDAGSSFSFFGWFKIIQTGTGSFFTPFCSYNFSGLSTLIEVGNSGNPDVVHISTIDDDVYASASLGAWHFFHVFYDGATGVTGFSLDNGAEVALPTPDVYGASATGGFQLHQQWSGGTGSVVFDEIGLKVHAKLTPTEVTYLYNGGAGRTWPL